jgi:hypothetical protein
MTAPRTHKPATSTVAQEAVVKAVADVTPKTPVAAGTVAKPAPKIVAKVEPAKPEAKAPAKAAPKSAPPSETDTAKTMTFPWGEVEVPDFTAYASKEPTQPVLDFLAWLQVATGVTFNEGEMRAAQLAAFGLRQKWQEYARHASPVARSNRKA